VTYTRSAGVAAIPARARAVTSQSMLDEIDAELDLPEKNGSKAVLMVDLNFS